MQCSIAGYEKISRDGLFPILPQLKITLAEFDKMMTTYTFQANSVDVAFSILSITVK